MAKGDTSERTEPASPKRRGEARRKGRVAQSRDLTTAVILLACWALFSLAGERLFQDLAQLVRIAILRASSPLDDLVAADGAALVRQVLVTAFELVLPAGACVVVTALVVGFLQTGFLFTPEPLTPDLSRLNPANGLKRLFSLRSAMATLTAALKFLALSIVVVLSLRADWNLVRLLPGAPPGRVALVLSQLLLGTLGKIAFALLLLALLDTFYQRWQYERDLRMTREEVKQEAKDAEGNPEVRLRIRRRQRALAKRRMVEEVKTATVVVVNPVHLAVALRYRNEGKRAPVVVAKGQGSLAARIRRIAEDAGVPAVENPPLARLLYRFVQAGTEIPPRFYVAVAEVLAYLYRLGRLEGV